MDSAHDDTTRAIKRLENRLAKEYKQAEKEMKQKVKKLMAKFKENDKAMRERIYRGEITRDDWLDWRERQLYMSDLLKKKTDIIAEYLSNVNEQATNIINGRLAGVYAKHANFEFYQIEDKIGINTSFTLFDANTVERLARDNPRLLPKKKLNKRKDVAWSKRKINNAIIQGILQGESVFDVAERMGKVAEMSYVQAKRTAQTAMTGAQNAGRFNSLKQAQDMGIKVQKQWMATLDNRTRSSHADVDGESVPIDKPFSNGLMYPADPDGAPAEVYNCRCTMVGDLVDYREEYQRYDNIEGEPIPNMTYREWEEAKKGKVETQKATQAKNIANREKSNAPVTQDPRIAQYIDNITEKGIQADSMAANRIDDALQRAAAKLNMTVQETKEAIEEGLQRIIDESDFIMRIRGSNLEKVLDDGFFKNQFETGSSGGAFNPTRRKDLEHRKFGVPEYGIDDADRPDYGMIAPKYDEYDSDIKGFYEHGAGSWYGDVNVVLKKDKIRNNATMTIGDSLDYDTSLVGTEVNNIKYAGSHDRGDKIHKVAKINKKTSKKKVEKTLMECTGGGDGYFEYQLHGKKTHSINNIDYVIIPQDSFTYYQSLIKKLERMKIPWKLM